MSEELKEVFGKLKLDKVAQDRVTKAIDEQEKGVVAVEMHGNSDEPTSNGEQSMLMKETQVKKNTFCGSVILRFLISCVWWFVIGPIYFLFKHTIFEIVAYLFELMSMHHQFPVFIASAVFTIMISNGMLIPMTRDMKNLDRGGDVCFFYMSTMQFLLGAITFRILVFRGFLKSLVFDFSSCFGCLGFKKQITEQSRNSMITHFLFSFPDGILVGFAFGLVFGIDITSNSLALQQDMSIYQWCVPRTVEAASRQKFFFSVLFVMFMSGFFSQIVSISEDSKLSQSEFMKKIVSNSKKEDKKLMDEHRLFSIQSPMEEEEDEIHKL